MFFRRRVAAPAYDGVTGLERRAPASPSDPSGTSLRPEHRGRVQSSTGRSRPRASDSTWRSWKPGSLRHSPTPIGFVTGWLNWASRQKYWGRPRSHASGATGVTGGSGGSRVFMLLNRTAGAGSFARYSVRSATRPVVNATSSVFVSMSKIPTSRRIGPIGLWAWSLEDIHSIKSCGKNGFCGNGTPDLADASGRQKQTPSFQERRRLHPNQSHSRPARRLHAGHTVP